ncbi:hypothetical protein CXB51_026163 [Gossypium anomalum]|uniref:Aminotransferase-like plant mobile domain-containing protein n=1 Tax=Gossypium anomalum TaxID=47600 RepID=A0A8J5YB12_9ROSI|nr:hypothetical protein CXB51_026163 [Gossypium anomalum]
MHWWKDGGSKHTFHLPFGECTITLEDVALQLGVPMDGPVITGFGIISDKVTPCQSMLGKVSNKFDGCRILINWLEDNFDEPPKDPEDQIEEVNVDWWLSTPTAIVGLVVTIIFMSQGDRPLYDPIGDEWNHGLSYVGLPEVLEDIRLLLDQRLEAEFEWMSYANIDVISCILLKVLGNRRMWDAKVSLSVEAFGWRQRILSPPQALKDQHKVDIVERITSTGRVTQGAHRGVES